MKVSKSFFTGAVALVFLIIGYQTALFVRHAAILHIVSENSVKDTVYIVRRDSVSEKKTFQKAKSLKVEKRKNKGRLKDVVETVSKNVIENSPPEEFVFNPNTASVQDFIRLGFSGKQAESIDNYRKKGGRFRRKEDFKKSFVVSEQNYERLKDFINIPLVDINKADSAELVTLPGIGKYLASEILKYREKLCGFSFKEQLTDIKYFDAEKLQKIEDLICCSNPEPYDLWNKSKEELSLHPYIGEKTAESIVKYKENNPVSEWSVKALYDRGIIYGEKGGKLLLCSIASPGLRH